MKMMAGAFSLAILNTSRTMRGPCKAEIVQSSTAELQMTELAVHTHVQHQGCCFNKDGMLGCASVSC